MNASTTLRGAQVVEIPSVGRSGRGFRGGFRLESAASPVLISLGEDPTVVGRVVEFSPEHVVLEWPSGKLGRSTGTARLRVRGFEELRFQVRPGMSNLRDRRGDVALDISAPTRSLAHALIQRGGELVRLGLANVDVRRAPMCETIESDRIEEVLVALMRNGFEGTVRLGDYPVGRATLAGVHAGQLQWRYIGPQIAGDVQIEIPGYNSVFALDVAVLGRSQVLNTSFPTTLTRVRHRAHRRVEAAEGLVVEFDHPMWAGHVVRRRVKEVSSGGLSFVTHSDEDLLYPELLVSSATLYAGDRALSFMGEVRSMCERGVERGEYCGMRVMPNSAEDESVWQNLLDEHLYPQTRKGAAYAGPTWDLYEKAGYFNLSGKTTEEFAELRRAFENVAQKLDAAPHLGCQVVWTDDEKNVEAALSMIKTYSSAWFGYQMAKVSGDTKSGVLGRSVLRDIHLHAYEHAQRDASMKWVIGIPQVKKVWSRLVHHDLPVRYVDRGQAAVVRFRAVEISCRDQVADAVTPSTDEVGFATDEERLLLLQEIARTRPRPYVEALDFVDERFDAAEICADWEYAGLERRRSVLVARRNGVAVAAAVLENAENGSHLFRLLDSVRLFSLVGTVDEAANAALLTAARGWFRRTGKSAFVAYLEDELALPAALTSVSSDLGLADFVILAAELVPELLEHVVEVTAPRDALATLTNAPVR